jgi:DHA2 family methylenomycin A resistance protein-like MFS transporter
MSCRIPILREEDVSNPNATSSRPVPAPARPDAPHARIALLIASLGFFLITLDILIINVALTSIGRELGGGTSGQQWVVDGYTLLFASLLLFAGNLSDRIGAKRALGLGIILFVLASAACALAPTLGVLIGARFAQGGAAAIMLPASMALIREAYPDVRRRAKAIGIWAVGGAAAGAVGPLLGGLLTTLDWRLVFAINVPVCIGMLVLLRYVLPSATRPAVFDWAGQALAITALAALTFGLIEGGSAGFSSTPVILTLVLAAAGIAGFLVIQARGRHPMMPLTLFHSTGFRIALSVGFAFMVGWFGTVFVLSLYLQQHLGLTPLQAGLLFLPSACFSVVGNFVSGPVMNRFGPRIPAVIGQVSMVFGLVAMLATAPLGSPLLVAILLIPIGAGGSLAMPPVTALVLESIPSERAGTASAVFNTFRQVGGAVAIAVFGALIADPATFISGMQVSFTIAASLLLITALVSVLMRSRNNEIRSHEPEAS